MGKTKGKPEPVDIGTLVTRTPGVVGGRPCVAGTAIPILRLAVMQNEGLSADEMLDEYPHLDLLRIYAGLAYYLANNAAIDSELDEERRQFDAAVARQEADAARISAGVARLRLYLDEDSSNQRLVRALRRNPGSSRPSHGARCRMFARSSAAQHRSRPPAASR
jgi:uncharacterized protein (DUF433 family)